MNKPDHINQAERALDIYEAGFTVHSDLYLLLRNIDGGTDSDFLKRINDVLDLSLSLEMFSDLFGDENRNIQNLYQYYHFSICHHSNMVCVVDDFETVIFKTTLKKLLSQQIGSSEKIQDLVRKELINRELIQEFDILDLESKRISNYLNGSDDG